MHLGCTISGSGRVRNIPKVYNLSSGQEQVQVKTYSSTRTCSHLTFYERGHFNFLYFNLVHIPLIIDPNTSALFAECRIRRRQYCVWSKMGEIPEHNLESDRKWRKFLFKLKEIGNQSSRSDVMVFESEHRDDMKFFVVMIIYKSK